ncbi:hypothetical protein NAL32_20565 [Chryseobacterium sp. Ch-15]|uniref:Uncharacterized protein n=1 Tax=Chryseobacterium muglaense TaxID=2893752 RepID=A0A9Q3YTH9_9FLAO|nr:hypothetical protein [Chryseobacterium muglaense]MBD3907083.1 hypothetical protein [Chryseobacterium muglaense]MBD3907090.1 hypothetical protein [Chryseobacterium muglaense]MCC9036533.1 hypothetical protein [Chryseobacterium muglaense]MCC9036540.1 hypothetical protein [Chryseobacterium muglaense]MCM2556780.1 hypothetical protein [Chryseobacterium muglaense]
MKKNCFFLAPNIELFGNQTKKCGFVEKPNAEIQPPFFPQVHIYNNTDNETTFLFQLKIKQ